MTEKKGQMPLISHVIVVGLGVVLILVIVYTLSSLEADYRNFIDENEMEQACYLIKGGIEKIYYSDYQNLEKGRIIIKMPDRISDINYIAEFTQYSVIIKRDDRKNVSCTIGFPAVYSGTTTGGMTEIIIHSLNGIDFIDMKRL